VAKSSKKGVVPKIRCIQGWGGWSSHEPTGKTRNNQVYLSPMGENHSIYGSSRARRQSLLKRHMNQVAYDIGGKGGDHILNLSRTLMGGIKGRN